jgi:hypothetical protein
MSAAEDRHALFVAVADNDELMSKLSEAFVATWLEGMLRGYADGFDDAKEGRVNIVESEVGDAFRTVIR